MNINNPLPVTPICWILFDFGGVVAEEGFLDYFAELSERYGCPRHELPQLALDTVYDSGYVTGQASETDFWNLLRERFPLTEPDSELSAAILHHFQPRKPVLALVDELRKFGFRTGVLSDQTDWLDKLDRRDDLFSHFDRVFNSYYLGKGKRDASLFEDVLKALSICPSAAIFIDDNPENVRRAVSHGLHGLHYENFEKLLQELASLLKIPAVELGEGVAPAQPHIKE